jgi:hypothetical protein
MADNETFLVIDSRTSFFHAGDFDINVAKFADSIKQPIALTEMLTSAAMPFPPYAFKGSVLVSGSLTETSLQSHADMFKDHYRTI